MMPILGECFGHFYTDAVHVEIFLVFVFGKQFSSGLAHLGPHGHDVKRGVVNFAAFNRAKEVGDAQIRGFVLAWIRKAHPFGGA